MMTIDGGPFYVTNEAAGNLLDLLKMINCDATPAQDIWELHLVKNDFDFDCTTVEADLVEADYDGYAAIPLFDVTDLCDGFIQGPNDLPDGTVALFLDQQEFPGVVAPAITNTIFGAYISNAAGDVLWIKKLAAPATIGGATDVLKVSGLLQIACSVPLPGDLP